MSNVAPLTPPDDERVSIEWNQDTLDLVADYGETWHDVQKKRKALNSKVDSKKDALIAVGMDGAALKAVIAFSKLSPEEQIAFDETYFFGRRAMGFPAQPDMITAMLQSEVVSVDRKDKAE
ncbi:MAG: hypothetical protein ACR2PR_07460 [Pseudohongiellaceae bacterium]